MNERPAEEARERERVRDAYRAYATDDRKRRAWDARNPGNVILRAEVLERILAETADQRAAGADVLDVGCGGGWWLAQLARAGVPAQRLHGVDLIAERVERVRSSVPGARVEVADAAALPFGDARFGVVLLLTTLSSAGGPARRRALLVDARRVLAPGRRADRLRAALAQPAQPAHAPDRAPRAAVARGRRGEPRADHPIAADRAPFG